MLLVSRGNKELPLDSGRARGGGGGEEREKEKICGRAISGNFWQVYIIQSQVLHAEWISDFGTSMGIQLYTPTSL